MTITSMILNFFSFYQIYIVVYALNILHNGSVVFGLLVGEQVPSGKDLNYNPSIGNLYF